MTLLGSVWTRLPRLPSRFKASDDESKIGPLTATLERLLTASYGGLLGLVIGRVELLVADVVCTPVVHPVWYFNNRGAHFGHNLHSTGPIGWSVVFWVVGRSIWAALAFHPQHVSGGRHNSRNRIHSDL